ncbi:MAG TPA: sigma-54 dependent transcriptional regulator [Gemmatimonadota bacterium]|nr:sigma-54 dependent transcriptional regulator [Gemmatimonadota bacterium]
MSPPGRGKILVVDDEPAMREVLRARLEEWGYEVVDAGSAAEATARAHECSPNLILADVVLPDATGLELLQALQSDDLERPVVLMTAHGTIDLAVDAMKAGASDFLTKPLDYRNLGAVLACAERELEERRRIRTLQAEGEGELRSMVGASRAMKAVRARIQLLAAAETTVLVCGESGTGKELVAAAIHESGRRREGPFVAVNTAAIPSELLESEIFGHEAGAFTGARELRRGCFEQAHGGTLLLDEIGEMPMALQPKILRVLEDGVVRRVGGSRAIVTDARVIASTNRDPWTAVREGKLREDLFHRLNVFTIEIPPLRHRLEDLPLLAQHWLDRFREKHSEGPRGFRDETLARMREYDWPGNVRELRNVVERAVVLGSGEWVEPAHLPPYVREPGLERPERIVVPPGTSLEEAERLLILGTLDQTGNNKAETARRLGVDVKTIRNKLRKYGFV